MTTLTDAGIGSELTTQALELVHVGTFVVDFPLDGPPNPKAGSARWSDELFRMIGLAPQELAPSHGTFMSFVVEQDRHWAWQVVERHFRDASPWAFDVRVQTRHRGERWFACRGNVVVNDAGRVTRMLGTAADVTDRVRETEERIKVETRFHTVLAQSTVGLAVADHEKRLILVNESFASLLGYRPNELIGRTFVEITHPDDVEATLTNSSRSFMHSRGSRYDKRYLRKDGSTLWARVTVSRMRIGPDAPDGYLGVIEDITEERETGAALSRQTEIFNSIMDHLPMMVALVDAHGRPQFANRECLRVFGWSTDDDPERIMESAFPEPFDKARVRQLLADGNGQWTDFEPVDSNGARIASSWAAVRLSDGVSLIIGQDLRNQRAMQQRLAQAQKMEAMGQLAGGVAHDFNNILTVITGGATFIESSTSLESSASDAKEILAACSRAAALTRQLLAFSRRQMLAPEIVNVNDTIAALSLTVRRLIGEHIQLAVDAEASRPTVEVDRNQLEQVILNLTVNARDAIGERGTITLGTRNALDDAGRDSLVLSVRDDGCGIDPAARQRIFEPFFTTKPVGQGTGLGLATVHGIVQQSGGTIDVDSTVGAGTTFRVTLPTVMKTAGPRSDRFGVVEAKGGSETILLVEDEAPVRAIVYRMLTGLGYRVLLARHGSDALTLAETSGISVDLLVTDVVMPEKGGRELATVLRSVRPNLPVLFISGYTDDELLNSGRIDATARLLRKPFARDDLARAIRALFAEAASLGSAA